MLNYTVSEAVAAISPADKITRRDVADILGFFVGFLLSTASAVGLVMMLNML